MTPDRRVKLTDFWYSALRAKIGLRISTNNFSRLRGDLYAVRQELADPDLAILSITTCPTNPTGELWITRRQITIEVPEEADVEEAPGPA